MISIHWMKDPDGTIVEFKDIEDGSRLAVSRDGEFLIRGRRRTFGTRRASGYLGLTENGTTVYAHRAVYLTWHGPIPPGEEIDHINCVKSDNRIENLRLVTKSENMRNEITREKNLSQLKTVRHLAREARVRRVVAIKDNKIISFNTVSEASAKTGVCRSDIYRAATGRRKTAAGFEWRYCK